MEERDERDVGAKGYGRSAFDSYMQTIKENIIFLENNRGLFEFEGQGGELTPMVSERKSKVMNFKKRYLMNLRLWVLVVGAVLISLGGRCLEPFECCNGSNANARPRCTAIVEIHQQR